MSEENRAQIAQVMDLVGRHQSKGRKVTYRLMGVADLETSAQGCRVSGLEGSEYLDLGSYSVFLLGHRNDRVVAAVERQLRSLPGSTRLLPSAVNAQAAQAVAEVAPAGLDKVLLLNSGAEAVEAAIKLVRTVTGRTGLVHLEHSFHGKTMGALALTDNPRLKTGSAPQLPDCHRISRSDPAQAAESIRRLRPAGVFFEAIQGEGGIFELAPEYLQTLRRTCDEVGALLVADEIQCGLGRSGTMWAFEPAAVKPDVLLMGKALGGGVMPVSALVATEAAFAPFDRDPFLHTSTFGGNPMAAAAAVASLGVIVEQDVAGRARTAGAVLKDTVAALVSRWPQLFTMVSGRGLMLGLHCVSPAVTALVVRTAIKHQLLVTPCIDCNTVVRLTPPAFMTAADLALVGRLLDEMLPEIEKSARSLR
jgi:putrescine aminotransferase